MVLVHEAFTCGRLRAARLKASPTMLQGTPDWTTVHIMVHEGVLPDPEFVQAIQHAPSPQDVSNLRRFLSMCTYYDPSLSRCTQTTVRAALRVQ